ncbi:mate-domain-containing protein [Hysterangium stoloniferum]|nr:mate-domain-containing protein [Hysterangium stoloniferum]
MSSSASTIKSQFIIHDASLPFHSDSMLPSQETKQPKGTNHCERNTLVSSPSQISYGTSPYFPKSNNSQKSPTANGERDPLLGDASNTIHHEEQSFVELWVLCKYAAPIFGTQLLEHSLSITSVVFIGRLSTTALAAATLGSMTASVTGFSIIQGLVSCMDTLLPGAWTGPHPELVGLWSQRMAVVLCFTLIPIYTIWTNAEPILLLLKQEPEIAHFAGLYLKWLSIGLPAYAFNQTSRRYFQSQGLFTTPTHVMMIIAVLNVLLNYLLVWGPSWICLGFIGGPLATAISYNIMSLIYLLYGIYWTSSEAWHPLTARSFTCLGIVIRLGLAGVGQIASEWWSWELVGLAASLLGAIPLASQSILLISASTTYQAPNALSIATSVRVGNLLGEGKGKLAGISARMSLVISLGVAIILRNKWAYMFSDDPLVVSLVASILPLVGLFQVFDGLATTTGGILRARGKQVTGALLNLTAYYIIGIPLGLYLAFRLKMGLFGMWVGLTAALLYCSAGGVWLCLRTDWDMEVFKVRDRAEIEPQMGAKGSQALPDDPERNGS